MYGRNDLAVLVTLYHCSSHGEDQNFCQYLDVGVWPDPFGSQRIVNLVSVRSSQLHSNSHSFLSPVNTVLDAVARLCSQFTKLS